MHKNSVDVVIRALLSTKYCLMYHKYAYEIFFTEMYLKKLGITFNGNKCPFCGRYYSSLFLHLYNHKSRCYNQLRIIVKHVLHLYKQAQRYVSKTYHRNKNGHGKTRYYCSKCGFNGFYFQVVYHILEEHINDTLW